MRRLIATARDEQLKEIERRRKMYLGNRPHPQLAAHTVIVVDDGIATGATTRAALQAVRLRGPSKLRLLQIRWKNWPARLTNLSAWKPT
jgi:predicted phosphoribosyltransferase